MPVDGVNVGESDPEPVDEAYRANLKAAQQAAGELLWLSTHTRPDISHAVSLIGSDIARRPSKAVARGKQVRRYLQAPRQACLTYGPAVESFSDASYAPTCSRPHGAYLTFWGGEVINWSSYKQPFITLSTAEAEMASLCDGAAAVHVVVPLLKELGQCSDMKVAVYTDNAAAVALTTVICESRVPGFVSEGTGLDCCPPPGRHLCADALTKPLPKERFQYLLGLIGIELWGSQLKATRDRGSASGGLLATPTEARVIVAACVVAASLAPVKAQPPDDSEQAWTGPVLWTGLLIALLLMWEGLGMLTSHVSVELTTGQTGAASSSNDPLPPVSSSGEFGDTVPGQPPSVPEQLKFLVALRLQMQAAS